MACLLPVLAYDAEARWPGHHRQGKQRSISNRVRAVFSCLENVFRQALQGSLPIYRTIPVPILHWEAAIPLLEHIFDHRWALAHLQAACLDNCHPVRRRLCKPQLTISCLHLHSLHPSCLEGLEQVSPILLPPWQPGTLISNKHGQNLPQPPDYPQESRSSRHGLQTGPSLYAAVHRWQPGPVGGHRGWLVLHLRLRSNGSHPGPHSPPRS